MIHYLENMCLYLNYIRKLKSVFPLKFFNSSFLFWLIPIFNIISSIVWLEKGLFIKAKDAVISVIEIQGENAKKMNVQDFLRGNAVNIGEIFE